MYSTLKTLLVLKLTLILLIITAGMGIVSEHPHTIESPESDIYHLMENAHFEKMIFENEEKIHQETNLSETVSNQDCPNKSSLGELRLYIEL